MHTEIAIPWWIVVDSSNHKYVLYVPYYLFLFIYAYVFLDMLLCFMKIGHPNDCVMQHSHKHKKQYASIFHPQMDLIQCNYLHQRNTYHRCKARDIQALTIPMQIHSIVYPILSASQHIHRICLFTLKLFLKECPQLS